jgi:ubiquinone/menaquinone biosynthesis C-methylase UbiE
MTNEIKDWWEKEAKTYQEMCNIPVDIHYGPGSPNEASLNLLGDLKDKKTLEIGCGGAQCSIAFAKQGAIATAIDISDEQLKFAKALADENKVNIEFYQGVAQDLKDIEDNSQDIVFSAMAFQFIDDLPKAFKEMNRVLKKGGLFVFSECHPFYRVPNPKTLKLEDSYFNTGRNVEDKTGSGFLSYSHTVSELHNALVNSGFFIQQMLEPDSRIRYESDPWYGLWDYYTPELLEKVPPTIIFKSIKM